MKDNRTVKGHCSPLRYPGGKTFLFHFFDTLLTNKSVTKATFVEPFAGGAGVSLALLLNQRVESIIINDLDIAIYSFWKSSVFHSKKFINKILSTPVTIEQWAIQKAVYSNPQDHDEFSVGFATFFLNRTNRSGIIEGGPIGGTAQNGLWKIDARFNKEALIERIELIAKFKKQIQVENKEGVVLVKEILKKKGVIVFADPPYFEKGSSLYLNHFQLQDHQLLARTLNKNSNANWVLTYDNKKVIKSLYSERQTINFTLNYRAYGSRIGKELMILSDSLAV
ncbi:MAG: DNA adenine methylase [Ignavibacteriota bacterium]